MKETPFLSEKKRKGFIFLMLEKGQHLGRVSLFILQPSVCLLYQLDPLNSGLQQNSVLMDF